MFLPTDCAPADTEGRLFWSISDCALRKADMVSRAICFDGMTVLKTRRDI